VLLNLQFENGEKKSNQALAAGLKARDVWMVHRESARSCLRREGTKWSGVECLKAWWTQEEEAHRSCFAPDLIELGLG